jgi:hypothetical protein
MVVKINDFPVDGNQVNIFPISHPSSLASTVAIEMTVGGVQ